MIEDAAVFINGRRQFKGVSVEFDSDNVVVKTRQSAEIARYSVVDVGKVGMAWDVTVDGVVSRLVAQVGCGCSGMKPYQNDPEYAGQFAK